MIVKMKKIHIVLQDKDVCPALDALGALGVLHIEHSVVPKDHKIDDIQQDVERLTRITDRLSELSAHTTQIETQDWRSFFESANDTLEGMQRVQEKMDERMVAIRHWEPWGNFDPLDVAFLKEHGVFLKLYTLPEERMDDIPQDCVFNVASVAGGVARIVVVSKEDIDLPFENIDLPSVSLSQLESLQEQDKRQYEEYKKDFEKYASYVESFRSGLRSLIQELAYQQALSGRLMEGPLTVIKGFVPAMTVPEVEALAQNRQWGYLIDDPSDEDIVPTLLKNPKWVEFLKPVMSIINVLPGYTEVDISAVFLVFFSFFFGVLIGDAGYGLVFAVGTAVAHYKFREKIKEATPFYLMYILSGCTILWGALTGTFFGQELFTSIEPLVPWLNDPMNVQRLCFFVGALHLSIAHIWRGVLKMPSPAAFAEVGWLCLLWGMFFMARVLVLGEPFVAWAKYLFIIGPILVAFFTKPNWNPLKALGGGLGDLVLNVVNTFTDVVSYIRLFAVGLATVAVADAFNVMALDLGFHSVLAGFLSALILVLGHVFNMVLGAMAILVHGLRLNVLEFSGHMNLEWAGIKYEPFEKKTLKQ